MRDDITVIIEAPVALTATLTEGTPGKNGINGTNGINGKDGAIQTVNHIDPDEAQNCQTIIELTQAVYDLIADPDPNVVYYITKE